MSYLLRVWMSATTVAAAEGHTHKSRRRLFSAGDWSELRPAGKSDVEDRPGQADDSLRKVMYFSCWGQG
ncbi:protein of wound-induced [Spatholobus suberectus]|nr:protein of wound-induced [Spatholobus suberectus]